MANPRQVAPSAIVWLIALAITFAATGCITRSVPSSDTHATVVATRLTALLAGELVMVDNCLRVTDFDGTSYLLAWPPEFAVNEKVDTVVIADGLTGEKVIWHIGQTVGLGGGIVPRALLAEEVRQRLRENCSGPYWLVGGVQ